MKQTLDADGGPKGGSWDAMRNAIAYDHGKAPDMLAWVLHDYWLHCQYVGVRVRMRDKLFPILRKKVNGYLNYLRENPVKSDGGLQR